ncbi:hypothetical protein G9A89_000420, partial [Geosiphon pyriformis]
MELKNQFKIVTEHGYESNIEWEIENNGDPDLQSVASTIDLQDIQDAQNVRVQEVIWEHRLRHQDMRKSLRKKVKYLRALERGPNVG